MLFRVACTPTTGAHSPWFGTATMGTATGPQGNTFATNIIVHLGHTGNVTNLDVTVTDPTEGRHTFAGLDLRVDGEYWIGLLALDGVDQNDPSGPPRQVNTVSQQSPEFAPTAPG